MLNINALSLSKKFYKNLFADFALDISKDEQIDRQKKTGVYHHERRDLEKNLQVWIWLMVKAKKNAVYIYIRETC